MDCREKGRTKFWIGPSFHRHSPLFSRTLFLSPPSPPTCMAIFMADRYTKLRGRGGGGVREARVVTSFSFISKRSGDKQMMPNGCFRWKTPLRRHVFLTIPRVPKRVHTAKSLVRTCEPRKHSSVQRATFYSKPRKHSSVQRATFYSEPRKHSTVYRATFYSELRKHSSVHQATLHSKLRE